MASKGSLSPKKTSAIVALLTARSVREASRLSGIPTRTLFRWLQEDGEFQEALQAQEAALLDETTRALTMLSSQAVNALAEGMSEEVAPYVKIRAAQATLDYLLRMRELRGLERRLDALEEAMAYE